MTPEVTIHVDAADIAERLLLVLALAEDWPLKAELDVSCAERLRGRERTPLVWIRYDDVDFIISTTAARCVAERVTEDRRFPLFLQDAQATAQQLLASADEAERLASNPLSFNPIGVH